MQHVSSQRGPESLKYTCRPLSGLAAVLVSALWSGFASGAAPGVQVDPQAHTVVIQTPRLAATFRDGMIVAVIALGTGEVHADAATTDELGVPSGLGHLTGMPEAVGKLHMPWGTDTLNQQIELGTKHPTMHRPHAGSTWTTADIEGGMQMTWTGLSNGAQMFPEETVSVKAWVDPATGALLFRATGTSPTEGVYGVQVPVANLHAEHRVYVASFGGIMYDSSGKPGLTTLGGTPFWEAPVVAIEGRQGSLGLWVEAPECPPDFFFMNWSGKSFSIAIEHLNLMPFEPHKSVESVTWRLDAVAGGWVAAMTPYRDWYARAFAEELRARAAVTWADRIKVIIDEYEKADPAGLRALATVFDPETVLLHEWNARAPEFDHELPDWTPRAGYVERVKAAQVLGFRTMAYVNTYCVNYNSPVFVRDRIQDFGLTRRLKGVSAYAKSVQDPFMFDKAKDGQILYLDPLSPRWRQYHTDMMVKWRDETGTDANYEDTGGCAGDFGNGVIEGKSGAQGSVDAFRDLLRRNPTVPMASEYGPHSIAFAVRWPLRYQQVWGGEATRVQWMTHQRPVSAFIHGPHHGAWVPTINAESNFLRHVVVACSDALGGPAQCPGTLQSLQANQGILVHMRWRAQLFSRKQLEPFFAPERWEPTLACMYQDRDGQIYKYYADAQAHRMVGPDGRELYARISGLNRYSTGLNLPGWPAISDGTILGLNPKIRYALVPGVPDRTGVAVTRLPEGVFISRFYETKAFTVISLEPIETGKPAQGEVAFRSASGFAEIFVNDQLVDTPKPADKGASVDMTFTIAFPANILFVKEGVQTVQHDQYFGDGHEVGRYILVDSGLDRGGEYVPPYRPNFEVPGEKQPVPFTFLSWGNDAEVTVDYLVKIPAKDSTLRVYLQHRQDKYGNGTIARLYVNGRMRHAYDFGPKPNPAWKDGMPANEKNVWDTAYHAWSLPLGATAGRTVLVTLATDGKASNNADSQWWSRPKFVQDPQQAESYLTLTKDGGVDEP
ncbi:MAG: hypothetical protein A3K19_33520 [Lentisphaerae bacterium RIFOXYB12_FULL_65_16]|nr:MAG: hypothetical protein A3K18_06005 [Lentisphaerae bacterium RIFOXYA12_64_32]OGV86949.1 MAG: hypothetical protein A3K19_33520 [Lentisphaerae bacterium RIFOXYB12_FULL_65_16]